MAASFKDICSSALALPRQPGTIHKRTLKFTTTLGLGLISLYLLGILVLTGVLLMFYYVPRPNQAYESIKDLQFVVTAGPLVRNMHYWAAQLLIVSVLLHLCRVFYTAAYKAAHRFNWVVGAALLLLTLGLSFTGSLLPWDQRGFWGVTVTAGIAGYLPVLGEKLKFLLFGDYIIGESALLRFYVLHVVALPLVACLLMAVHLWRVRKHGLARPSESSLGNQDEARQTSPAITPEVWYAVANPRTAELPRSPAPEDAQILPQDQMWTWPHLIFRAVLLLMATSAIVLLLSIFWNAPLQAMADPTHPPAGAQMPWYLLAWQQLASSSAFWGGVVAPVLLLTALFTLPYLDRRPSRAGVWFGRERKAAVAIFTLCLLVLALLIVIGSYGK